MVQEFEVGAIVRTPSGELSFVTGYNHGSRVNCGPMYRTKVLDPRNLDLVRGPFAVGDLVVWAKSHKRPVVRAITSINLQLGHARCRRIDFPDKGSDFPLVELEKWESKAPERLRVRMNCTTGDCGRVVHEQGPAGHWVCEGCGSASEPPGGILMHESVHEVLYAGRAKEIEKLELEYGAHEERSWAFAKVLRAIHAEAVPHSGVTPLADGILTLLRGAPDFREVALGSGDQKPLSALRAGESKEEGGRSLHEQLGEARKELKLALAQRDSLQDAYRLRDEALEQVKKIEQSTVRAADLMNSASETIKDARRERDEAHEALTKAVEANEALIERLRELEGS